MKNKSKVVMKFRVTVGQRYCSLSTSFHELGAVIPDQEKETAHIFGTRAKANNAIKRTLEIRDRLANCLISDFNGFQPLRFQWIPTVEEFQCE